MLFGKCKGYFRTIYNWLLLVILEFHFTDHDETQILTHIDLKRKLSSQVKNQVGL